jgi:hypothetical protein
MLAVRSRASRQRQTEPGGGFDLTDDLADAPVCFRQGHSDTTTDFQWLFGAFGSHTILIGIPTPFLWCCQRSISKLAGDSGRIVANRADIEQLLKEGIN